MCQSRGWLVSRISQSEASIQVSWSLSANQRASSTVTLPRAQWRRQGPPSTILLKINIDKNDELILLHTVTYSATIITKFQPSQIFYRKNLQYLWPEWTGLSLVLHQRQLMLMFLLIWNWICDQSIKTQSPLLSSWFFLWFVLMRFCVSCKVRRSQGVIRGRKVTILWQWLSDDESMIIIMIHQQPMNGTNWN